MSAIMPRASAARQWQKRYADRTLCDRFCLPLHDLGAGMPLLRPLIALAVAVAFSASTTAFAAGDAARGKVLSYTCLGCHGIEDYRNAYPDYNVPRLAGQHADYIVAALKEYKDGERQHATMQVQAATLSDQDMA